LHPIALRILGAALDLEKGEIADRLGISRGTLRRLEAGRGQLSRSRLEEIAAALGTAEEGVEAALAAAEILGPADSDDDLLPLSPVERRAVERAVGAAAAGLRKWLVGRFRAAKIRTERAAAEELFQHFRATPPDQRPILVDLDPEFQTWAFCERLCQESAKTAAADPRKALAWANLALRVGGRVAGTKGWRLRLQGYAWAFVGNARRAGNDFRSAEAAFSRVRKLFEPNAEHDPGILDASRPLDLEASLRRDQRRFAEALSLLDRALVVAAEAGVPLGRLYLNKASTLEQMGNVEAALGTLRAALPWVEADGDPRQRLAIGLNLTVYLLHLGRVTEAAELLPEVRSRAIDLGGELDLLRVLWLAGRLRVAEGDPDAALPALDQARRGFAERGLACDAALVGLEEAALDLDGGRFTEVRARIRDLLPAFEAQGITREGLAAIHLFVQAVEREAATGRMARELAATLPRHLLTRPLPIGS